MRKYIIVRSFRYWPSSITSSDIDSHSLYFGACSDALLIRLCRLVGRFVILYISFEMHFVSLSSPIISMEQQTRTRAARRQLCALCMYTHARARNITLETARGKIPFGLRSTGMRRFTRKAPAGILCKHLGDPATAVREIATYDQTRSAQLFHFSTLITGLSYRSSWTEQDKLPLPVIDALYAFLFVLSFFCCLLYYDTATMLVHWIREGCFVPKNSQLSPALFFTYRKSSVKCYIELCTRFIREICFTVKVGDTTQTVYWSTR